ncbi:hypothetical protein [Leptolyngbya sp. AN10]|uniref:hypothetical protein n=1 Tax=Leptolyngbya sp. AN10 TaxID=3423365 RepID=UPI003D31BD62
MYHAAGRSQFCTPVSLQSRPMQTFGNPVAYIFQHRNGCWGLTQKLRSTKPQ